MERVYQKKEGVGNGVRFWSGFLGEQVGKGARHGGEIARFFGRKGFAEGW